MSSLALTSRHPMVRHVHELLRLVSGADEWLVQRARRGGHRPVVAEIPAALAVVLQTDRVAAEVGCVALVTALTIALVTKLLLHHVRLDLNLQE